MGKHAYLSASSAHRWMNCTRSPALCADMENQTSQYAQEGTDAHALCEYKVNTALGRDSPDPTEDLDYFDNEMDQCTDDYRDFVMSQLEDSKQHCSDPLVLVEARLDFSRYVPEAFGTGDAIIVADDLLTVIDFKYGVGVLVEAENNPQMRCYALGALDTYGSLYDIKTVRMCIFQPRRSNVSISEMDVGELKEWAENELKPKAQMAFNGEGEPVPGDYCIFCAAKAVCRARADFNLELEKYGFDDPETLEDSEIAGLLPRIESLVEWGSQVKDYALKKALAGTRFEGYKLVEGRSTRRYTDEEAVAETVKNAGFDPYEHKVLGITAMTKVLGKKTFDELLSNLVHKGAGAPVLVPESDKRPEINSINDRFDGGNENE